MAKKAQQRKNDGKDTVFYWNDQRLTADDVAQRNGKAWQNQSDDCKCAPLCSDKGLFLIP